VGLIDDLKPGPVALDTQVFIYFIEESKQCLLLVKPLFEAIDQGSLPAATSGLTLKGGSRRALSDWQYFACRSL
jgi:hypothetical protein